MNRRLWLAVVMMLGTVPGIFILPPAPAQAASTTFSQKILPLNCVFQEVNDGTGTLIYLTPEECGVILTPPPSGAPNASPTNPGSSVYPLYLQVTDPKQQTVMDGLPLQPSDGTPGRLPVPARDFAADSDTGDRLRVAGGRPILVIGGGIAAAVLVQQLWVRRPPGVRKPRR